MIKLLIIVLFPLVVFSQKKEEYIHFLTQSTTLSLTEIETFEKIYFVRFDYCSGSLYCGKKDFHLLVDSTAMMTTLFVIDTAYNKIKLPYYMENKTVVYVNRERLMRKGLFTSRTILIENKRKKIKRLP